MWKLSEIAHGRKTCDNYDLEGHMISQILSKLEKNFELDFCNKGTISVEFAGLDLFINGENITIGWDNWSGLFIMSREISGNGVIEKIYEYLNNSE